MKTNWQVKWKVNEILISLLVLIILTIIDLWGNKIVLFLNSQLMLNIYPQVIATLIGVSAGIPAGLFINSFSEKKRDKKILRSILVFIKTELISNKKYIDNLQDAAIAISSLDKTDKREDLKALSKFTNILSQESYIAAQSSIAFAGIDNDILITNIVNAYLYVQRIIGGAVPLEDVEIGEENILLIDYIKLCERAKESIRSCLLEIEDEFKKIGSTLTIVE